MVYNQEGATQVDSLLGRAGELGDGLGALGDGVLGELSGEDETDGRLDLSRRDGRLLVVRRELGGLGGCGWRRRQWWS